MHRGSAGGAVAVVGGTKSRAGNLVARSLDGGVQWAREHSLPSLIGGWFGEIGGIVLAVALLALFGLALVALSNSNVRTLSRSETSSGRELESSAGTEPETTTQSGADTDVVADEDHTGRARERERTDREEIVDMLRTNEGRMRQAAIVEDTDWSKSKVSMVLSEMEERGEISKLRVGRENIVSLQGKEPEAAGSPFDEE